MGEDQWLAICFIMAGVRFFMISFVILSRSNLGAHPQSFLATSSYRQCGQLFAMFCRISLMLYSIQNPGRFFFISAASSLGLKVMPLMLQLVLTVSFSLGASMSCKVPSMASSVQTMGRQLFSLRQQTYFSPMMALWKMSTAQSVVPPPGADRQPTSPGYLRLRTSTPQRAWQYWHQSSPDFLVMPYTVFGSMMVNWGVLLGVLLPKAAMELGQKIFWILPSLAASRQLKRAVMLICSVLRGSRSPVAERSAARQQTSPILCFSMMEQSC